MELLKARDHNGEYRSLSDQGGTTFSLLTFEIEEVEPNT
jgi:hypothetical protein